MNQIKAGAILNYVIIGLNTLTGLLYTPFMLRCLGQNEYGLYSLVASVIAYLTLLDFGFGSAIVRYTAKIRATSAKEDEWSLYGMFLSVYLVLGIFITVGGVVLYANTDRMFDQTMTADELNQARIMMALMVGNLAITFPFSIFGSIISAYERFVFQRIVSILRIILSTAVLIVVLSCGYKAIALVVVQTVFSIATLLLNLVYCFKKLKIKIRFGRFDMPLLKDIAIFSFWNFMGAIVDRIYWGTGQFILGIYSGTVAVALFSLAITLMNMYMQMSTSFNSVLLPRITAMVVKPGREREVSDIFIKTGRLQFCVLALITAGFTIFGRQFVTLWAGESYITTYSITLIFFFSLICPLIQNVGLTIIQARGQQKFRSLVYLGISVASLVAQIFVTERYGALGCAVVIGVTLFVGQWVIMNIYYHRSQSIDIPMFWKQIIRMALAPVALTVIGLMAVRVCEINTWLRLAVAIGIFCAIYVPVFYALSMNRYEQDIVKAPFKKLFPSFCS